MFSANGNFYKNSHIIENMENPEMSVNSNSGSGIYSITPSTYISASPSTFTSTSASTSNSASASASTSASPSTSTSDSPSGKQNPKVAGKQNPKASDVVLQNIYGSNFTNKILPSGNQNPKASDVVLQNIYGSNFTNKILPSGNQNPPRILITELAADSKNIHLNEYKYLMFNELDNNINLFNNITQPFIKKIIEINIYFNIYNNTKSPTNSTFTVNTNKQVTFEYNYNNNNKYLNNFTKITLGNDDLTKYATDHTFTIDIKPNSTIRCKLTVMPNTNEIYSETITYEPEIIIKNLKTAISNAGKLV
jgi:hypothetical protein